MQLPRIFEEPRVARASAVPAAGRIATEYASEAALPASPGHTPIAHIRSAQTRFTPSFAFEKSDD